MDTRQKQALIQKCAATFTPSTPINKRALFAGRIPQFSQIIDSIHSPGRHAIIYGDRGVGKTSLVSILKDNYAHDAEMIFARINCDRNDTFDTSWIHMLMELPNNKEQGKGTIEGWMTLIPEANSLSTASNVRQCLQSVTHHLDCHVVLIFDEFDRMDSSERAKFAALIKDSADVTLNATIILVGVANDITELINDHSSVSRNLTQIPMHPMQRFEVKEIIDNGLAALGMEMTKEASEAIITLSQGYPHFAHLLCKKTIMSSISRGQFKAAISNVDDSIAEAISESGYNIAENFHKAIQSQRKGTIYFMVLLACALSKVDDLGFFTSSNVAVVLSALAKKNYSIPAFSRHLNHFSSQKLRGPCLEKKGTPGTYYSYKFSDPLLRPYVVLRGIEEDLISLESIKKLEDAYERPKKAYRKVGATTLLPKSVGPRVAANVRGKNNQKSSLFDSVNEPTIEP